jgi:hypothetical protein
MLGQRRIREGFQLCLQASLQRFDFLGRASGDRFGAHMSPFSALFEIAPDGRETDSQHPHNFAAWDPLIHCAQHAFSHIL